jgi:hypothetical protein
MNTFPLQKGLLKDTIYSVETPITNTMAVYCVKGPVKPGYPPLQDSIRIRAHNINILTALEVDHAT